MAAAVAISLAGKAIAGAVDVPNGSFEAPATEFVDTRLDFWEKTSRPVWWDENAYGPWDQLIGSFANVAPEDPRHIDNCHGNQAIWLFANPQVGLFQDYESTDWSAMGPLHAFDARFRPGNYYQLTVGVFVGAAYPMSEGATLELSLYHRDALGNRVNIASTVVTNAPAVFTQDVQHLLDFRVNVPPVKNDDPWRGEHIGIAIMSSVFEVAGGYWVIDNVRLTEHRAPVLVGAAVTNGSFGVCLESEPGARLELIASTNIALPLTSWTTVGTVTNTTGSIVMSGIQTDFPRRFYMARVLE